MSGVLDGIEVVELTTGIAGPMTGMLLADQGARVTRIERPGGDPAARAAVVAGVEPGEAQRGPRPRAPRRP